jgi:hypothetical protein
VVRDLPSISEHLDRYKRRGMVYLAWLRCQPWYQKDTGLRVVMWRDDWTGYSITLPLRFKLWKVTFIASIRCLPVSIVHCDNTWWWDGSACCLWLIDGGASYGICSCAVIHPACVVLLLCSRRLVSSLLTSYNFSRLVSKCFVFVLA